jgi:hypothetical protein
MNVYITAHYVNIALGSFVFYENNNKDCFLELFNEFANGTSSKMQLPIDFKMLNLLWRAEQTKRQRILSFRQAQGRASEKTGFWFAGD